MMLVVLRVWQLAGKNGNMTYAVAIFEGDNADANGDDFGVAARSYRFTCEDR